MADSALNVAHAFNFSPLSPAGHADLNQTVARQYAKYTLGGVCFVNSPFGPRVHKYIQNRIGSGTAMAQGALVSGVGGNDGKTAITCSATSGSSAKAIVTTGLTADAHIGAIIQCLDKASSVGAAPEGEATICKANTDVLVSIEDDLPFSTAILVSDTFVAISTYGSEAAAAGDLAAVVQGVVLGRDGIPDTYCGWVSQWGNTPNTLLKASTAMTSGDALVADTGRVGPASGGSAANNLQIGYSAVVVTSDIVSDKFLAFMMLGFGVTPGTTDVSA